MNIIKSTLDGVQDNVTKLKRGQVKIKSTLGKVENNVEEITQLFEDDIYHQHQRITRLENIHQLPTLSRVVSSK